ncbi:MAG: SH3 domain-containing protein [Rhodobacteraceae bacterium]|nr:SH3 domain-containing protein [Paracoccaceae bacterium]
MIRAFLIVLTLTATAARADVFPALYDVIGVAADDVLNIRAAPDAGSEKVGELLPTDKMVEVIALNARGTWGQVNSAERSGWVSMKFLVRREGTEGAVLPLPLSCFATEPFWTLDLKPDNEVHFDRFTDPMLALTLFQFGRSANRSDVFGFVAQGSVTLSGTVRRATCNDGMSDRIYGLDLQLMQLGSEIHLWSGCCSLK